MNKNFTFIAILLFFVSNSFAEVRYVTSHLDDSSTGTLRQVIESALPGDSIVINELNGDIVLNGEIQIAKDIAVNGQNAVVRVNEPGVSTHRIFQLGDQTLQTRVAVGLYNLTLKGGNIANTVTSVSDVRNCGGCILFNRTAAESDPSLLILDNVKFYSGSGNYSGAIQMESRCESVVRNCHFEGNSATTNNAGALYSKGKMLMDGCTFTDNSAGKDGAAIVANNQSTILNTLFINNHASVIDGNNGGAVFNAAGGVMLAENCTFQNNTAIKGGGGFACSGDNEATFLNCTFYGNTMNDAAKGGGAVCIIRGNIAFINCTIAGNSIIHADNTKGAGIYSENAASILTLANTIVAHNTAGTASEYSDVYLSAGSLRGTNNVIGIKGYATENTDDLTGNIAFSYDPESTLFVSPIALADNGGTTPTIALAATGSVADEAGVTTGRYATGYAFQIDGGSWKDIRSNNDVSEPVDVIDKDQREYTRTAGKNPSAGAYELNTTLTAVPHVQKQNSFEVIAKTNALEVKVSGQGKLAIYNLQGGIVFHKTVDAGSSHTVSVMSGAVYLVKFNDKCTKVIIR
jgi:predicted outer membrane repeat protein